MADWIDIADRLPTSGGGRIGEMLRSDAGAAARRCLAEWPRTLDGIVAMVLDSPMPMIVAWGPDLRIIYNDSYAEVLGERHPAALGAPIEEVWARTWLQREAAIARVLAGETVVSGNKPVAVTTADGIEQRWFTVSVWPLRDAFARIGGLMSIGVDVTPAVQSEDRLLYERNRIRDLFQQAPGFMAMATGPDHVIEFANDAYFSLVGDRQLVGKPIRQALPELEGQGVFEQLDEAYRTGTPFIGREMSMMLARHGAGALERRYIDTVYQPIKQDGVVVGILAEGYDVTEQKKAKEELMHLQTELIHVSRVGAMSAMAATLAHELNQPLTAIKAYVVGARRMLDEAGAAALDDVRRALVEVSEASTRAGEIIRRLRTMVRRGEPEVELADFGSVVREAVSLASLGLADEGVVVTDEIAADLCVKVDKVQIQQVVVNLFRNAVEATRGAERREIRIVVREMRGSALLQVEDSGEGIDSARAQDIFSPMFTTKPTGLGVGLPISRTIVEAHRGTMWASESILGGASLSVKVPLAVAAQGRTNK